jgi:hypothetical protein
MITEGSKVQWSHISSRGRSFSASLREGTVQHVSNGLALVMKPSKRTEYVPVEHLQLQGEKSHISFFVEAITRANRGR